MRILWNMPPSRFDCGCHLTRSLVSIKNITRSTKTTKLEHERLNSKGIAESTDAPLTLARQDTRWRVGEREVRDAQH